MPDEVLPLIGEFFPRFVVRDLEAGHWVISERPEGVRSSVREFLGGVWEEDRVRSPGGKRRTWEETDGGGKGLWAGVRIRD